MPKATAPSQLSPFRPSSVAEMERGIARLEERIRELEAFDARANTVAEPPQITVMSSAIQGTLEKIFGGTSTLERYSEAWDLQWTAGMFYDNYPNISHYREGIARNIQHSLALLGQAIQFLKEEIEDSDLSLAPPTKSESQNISRRVFVVHGHDGEAKEAVARYLSHIGFTPIILHEQANEGRTIIEKVEANSNVGFAVVLLTPDDLGSVKDGTPSARARQNVILELGYFIGRLGRKNVCALKRGDIEVPSDFGGVVYDEFDSGGAWKQALARELKAAGHSIDWNKVMG